MGKHSRRLVVKSLHFINNNTKRSGLEKNEPACNQNFREDTDSPKNGSVEKGIGFSPNEKCVHYDTALGCEEDPRWV